MRNAACDEDHAEYAIGMSRELDHREASAHGVADNVQPLCPDLSAQAVHTRDACVHRDRSWPGMPQRRVNSNLRNRAVRSSQKFVRVNGR